MQPSPTFPSQLSAPPTEGQAPSQGSKQRRPVPVIRIYAVAVVLLGVGVNALVGISAYEPTLPSMEALSALAVTGALLLANHTWLMTVTEEVRHYFQIPTTPENWKERGLSPEDIEVEGVLELQRHHGAHRNATENTALFAFVAIAFVLAQPSPHLAQAWPLAFGLARIGHTYGYLQGNDSVRGLFMTLSLMSLYGMASYTLMALMLV